MVKIALDQQPKFLDAIIPGRYHYRLGLHDEESPKEIGSGHLVKNLVTTVWLAWFPFWLLLTIACGAADDFGRMLAGIFGPFGILVLFNASCLFVFYPGCYYLFCKQGVSLRHLSHHFFTTSQRGLNIVASKHWLAWWRAVLLPGVDVGNMQSKRLGRITGATQIATFLAVLFVFSGPSLDQLLSAGRTQSFLPLDALSYVLVGSETFVGIFICWGLSLILFCVNYSYGCKWVEHVADMSPEERSALPL